MGRTLKPNKFLTNISIAHFQNDSFYAARKVFPIVRVPLQAAHYNIFGKGDLARDDMRDKPIFGKVEPSIISQSEDTYSCKEKQIILGIDQIGANNTARMGVPGVADPRLAKTRVIAEKMNIHLDAMFANSFFKSGVWSNEYTGTESDNSGKNFIKFDNGNSDPVKLILDLKREMLRQSRRRPNKLTLGANTFDALTQHPAIMERIKYTGTTANPAVVTERVLAELFGVEDVLVLESTYNAAAVGEETKMEFICEPKGALLSYAPSTASIDEPSAGYIFAWDMGLGGDLYYVDSYEGEKGTHTEYVEGMASLDMKKTGDDMAVYLKDCVD